MPECKTDLPKEASFKPAAISHQIILPTLAVGRAKHKAFQGGVFGGISPGDSAIPDCCPQLIPNAIDLEATEALGWSTPVNLRPSALKRPQCVLRKLNRHNHFYPCHTLQKGRTSLLAAVDYYKSLILHLP